MTYFHKSAAIFEPADVLYPGTWGRLLTGGGMAHHQFYREYVWERIRQLRYPSLPSRMTSIFAFETPQAAAGFPNRGRPEYVYEVDVKGTPPIHRADMTWFEEANQRHTFDGVDDCVDRYWRGEIRDSVKIELIIEGDLVVVRRVTPMPDDSLGATAGAP